MPLPVRPMRPLIGAKRSGGGPGPSYSADSPTAAAPPKKVRMCEMEIQISETTETLDKMEKDWQELHAKLEEHKAIAREQDEWKKKHDELQITLKEEKIEYLKELYTAKVGQISPEVLATMNSDGYKDAPSRTKTEELCIFRESVAPSQTSLSASSYRNTIPDPSDTYMAPQLQESFNQVARAAMSEIIRTSGRTLGRVVTSQRTDRSSSNSEQTSRAIVPAGPALRSRLVDIRRNLAFRNFFLQVAAQHPRAFLNGMRWKPAISNQAIPSGSRHLAIADSLLRDLNEIFVSGQTTPYLLEGPPWPKPLKCAPVTPEGKWDPLLVCLLNELKEKYKPRLVVLCTIPQNPDVGTPVTDFLNGNVTRWNDMIRNLVRSNPGGLRLMDLEITLRMTDHLALTRNGIHFKKLQGRRWINDVFQTRIEEKEGELRTTDSLAWTSLTGGGRVRGNVPEPLASRLRPLVTEASSSVPAAPSSDVRERLGTAPPPRR